MKKIVAIFWLIILCTVGFSQTYNGTILRVIDGDTFVFQTEGGSVIVRMDGIDAPEKDQPFGRESTEFIGRYLNRDAVLVRHGLDRYDRTLGTLYVNGQDINLLSIKGGYSWHYKKYSKDQVYANAEVYARQKKLGLWSQSNPIPPWDWRKK